MSGKRDYSLTGAAAKAAVEKGLASANGTTQKCRARR